jgi:hypothetical protein
VKLYFFYDFLKCVLYYSLAFSKIFHGDFFMRAFIYARQSSGGEEKSLSIEQQLQNCVDLCKRKGWEIGGKFSDFNTSGRTYPAGAELVAMQDRGFVRWMDLSSSNKSFRKGLGELLPKLGQDDVIVVDDITRLCRPATMSSLVNFLGNLFITDFHGFKSP